MTRIRSEPDRGDVWSDRIVKRLDVYQVILKQKLVKKSDLGKSLDESAIYEEFYVKLSDLGKIDTKFRITY